MRCRETAAVQTPAVHLSAPLWVRTQCWGWEWGPAHQRVSTRPGAAMMNLDQVTPSMITPRPPPLASPSGNHRAQRRLSFDCLSRNQHPFARLACEYYRIGGQHRNCIGSQPSLAYQP